MILRLARLRTGKPTVVQMLETQLGCVMAAISRRDKEIQFCGSKGAGRVLPRKRGRARISTTFAESLAYTNYFGNRAQSAQYGLTSTLR
jgi:hypothetical protein